MESEAGNTEQQAAGHEPGLTSPPLGAKRPFEQEQLAWQPDGRANHVLVLELADQKAAKSKDESRKQRARSPGRQHPKQRVCKQCRERSMQTAKHDERRPGRQKR